jgi:hypothetical protein
VRDCVYFPHRAKAAFRACAVRSASVSFIRARVAFFAFLALDTAFLGVFIRPKATAAGFLRDIGR